MTRSDTKNIHTDLHSLKASLFDSVTRFPAYPAVFDRLKQMTRNRLLGQIIAEGIQTDREMGVLYNLGVPLGQGFLFGLPAQEFFDPRPYSGMMTAAGLGGGRSRSHRAGTAAWSL